MSIFFFSSGSGPLHSAATASGKPDGETARRWQLAIASSLLFLHFVSRLRPQVAQTGVGVEEQKDGQVEGASGCSMLGMASSFVSTVEGHEACGHR
jgi:hypothetical protein